MIGVSPVCEALWLRDLFWYTRKILNHKMDYNVDPSPINWNIWTITLPDIQEDQSSSRF